MTSFPVIILVLALLIVPPTHAFDGCSVQWPRSIVVHTPFEISWNSCFPPYHLAVLQASNKSVVMSWDGDNSDYSFILSDTTIGKVQLYFSDIRATVITSPKYPVLSSPPGPGYRPPLGAILGGSIGGVAFITILISVAAYLLDYTPFFKLFACCKCRKNPQPKEGGDREKGGGQNKTGSPLSSGAQSPST